MVGQPYQRSSSALHDRRRQRVFQRMSYQLLQGGNVCWSILRNVRIGQKAGSEFIGFRHRVRYDRNLDFTPTGDCPYTASNIKRVRFSTWTMAAYVNQGTINLIGSLRRAV